MNHVQKCQTLSRFPERALCFAGVFQCGCLKLIIPPRITKMHTEKYWTKRGVACLLQLDDWVGWERATVGQFLQGCSTVQRIQCISMDRYHHAVEIVQTDSLDLDLLSSWKGPQGHIESSRVTENTSAYMIHYSCYFLFHDIQLVSYTLGAYHPTCQESGRHNMALQTELVAAEDRTKNCRKTCGQCCNYSAWESQTGRLFQAHVASLFSWDAPTAVNPIKSCLQG